MSKKAFSSILILGFFLLVIGFVVRVSKERVTEGYKINENPKLVVGIVVDQMKHQYLNKYWAHYSDRGFKKLIKNGFIAKSNHYGYAQTSTGPGHATVATGTYPSVHGIINNSWFDKKLNKSIYCVDDNSYFSVGSESDQGKKSPVNMLTTTLADENRIATNFKGKTIGVAIKDRGAILSSGHTANAAYWFEGGEKGSFITSSYYVDSLPSWVKEFNTSRVIDKYLKTWNTYYDISTYNESGPDDNNYESNFKGEEKPVFPHNFKIKSDETGKSYYGAVASTPFGNSLVADFAIEAVENEKLGEDTNTDFLLIDFSSSDYVGHQFGVNSKEVQDTYIRLDKEIERLLDYFDNKVGPGNYTIFLTADHGATYVPGFLKDSKIPVNYFNSYKWKKHIENSVLELFKTKKVLVRISGNQIFLNHKLIEKKNLNFEEVQSKIMKIMQSFPGIGNVYSSQEILNSNNDHHTTLVRNGFNKNLSGDIVYTLMPNWKSPRKGSTHGSMYDHDTHVPLIFYGNGIKKGSISRRTDVIDIAPTIATVLGINSPDGSTGQVIHEAIDD